jgi:WD40 repeat protein
MDTTLPPPHFPTLEPAAIIHESVPGYEILRELGRGGMGVVYQARQTKLDRVVALKMILAGGHAGETDLARFRTEGEAIARLQHPNIVQIYEVGEHQGRPFLALEYCAGDSLEKKLNGTPLPARTAAAMMAPLARAVEAAHRRGVVHRDLKPANILLQPGTQDQGDKVFALSELVPKITDFGLAKKLDEASKTVDGSVMGTPSYMAPEQAGGQSKDIGPAADVYSLGAILYECLTGRPPFRAPTALDTLFQVINDEPAPPSRLQPKTPKDLETICLKCLHKQPHRRYASARELADDLGHYLAGEPVHARPVGWLERGTKWARRRPTAAALLALSLAAGLALLGGAAWFTDKLRRERDRADERAAGEKEARELAVQESRRGAIILADQYTATGMMADRDSGLEAALWFAYGAGLAPHAPERAAANRLRFALWSRGQAQPIRAIATTGRQWVRQLSPHPAGRHLLTDHVSGEWLLWDLESEKQITWPNLKGKATAAAWSPGGKLLVVGTEAGETRILAYPSLRLLHSLEKSPGAVTALAFSRDGRFLAVGASTVRVWDCRSEKYLTPAFPYPGIVSGLSFDADASRLAVTGSTNQAQVLRLPANGNPGALERVFEPVVNKRLQYHPRLHLTPIWINSDRELLTYDGKADLLWWDAATGKEVRRLKPELWNVDAAAVSPNGRYLAVGGWFGVRFYDAANGRAIGNFPGRRPRITCMAFSPDGQTLLTGTCSGQLTVQRISVPDGRLVGSPLAAHPEVWSVTFGQGGVLLAGAADGLVRCWRSGQEVLPNFSVPVLNAKGLQRTLLSSDGRWVLARPGVRSAQVLDARDGRAVGPVHSLQDEWRSCVFLGARPRVLTLTASQLDGWDGKTGKRLFKPLRTPTMGYGLTASPDGKRAVVLCAKQALVIDPEKGVVLQEVGYPTPADLVNAFPHARFSPDGRSWVTYDGLSQVVVYDAATGRPRFAPLQHGHRSGNVVFSRDGKLLATSCLDSKARVFEADTGKLLATLKHPDWVLAVSLSADGRLLATACRDGSARVWDWRSGKLACPPLNNDTELNVVAFLPGSDQVFTACPSSRARVWDVHSGKPLTPWIPLIPAKGGLALARASAESAEVSPDGARILVSFYQGSAQVFDLKPLQEVNRLDTPLLKRLAEVNATQMIHEGGGVVNLTADEWFDRWTRLRQAQPDLHRLPVSGGQAEPIPK